MTYYRTNIGISNVKRACIMYSMDIFNQRPCFHRFLHDMDSDKFINGKINKNNHKLCVNHKDLWRFFRFPNFFSLFLSMRIFFSAACYNRWYTMVFNRSSSGLLLLSQVSQLWWAVVRCAVAMDGTMGLLRLISGTKSGIHSQITQSDRSI